MLTYARQLAIRLAQKFLARYEGAQPSSPRRSWVPNYVRDARFDITSFTRWELTRKIRYFEANSWLVQRLADLFEQYVVGCNGMGVMPASSDVEWNTRALPAWQEWCQMPDLCSRQNLGTLQGLIARSWFVDGEIFILKTYGRDRPGRQAFPRIQLIESHRCSAPGNGFSDATKDNLVDGVQVDPTTGRPQGYWIRDGFSDSSWTYKDADSVIHVFEPSRPGQYRGITFFHAVLCDLHDLDDLQIMEMDRAKQASEIANIFETYSGELDPRTLRQGRLLNTGATGANAANPDEDLEKRIAQYRTILGSRTIAVKPGESIKQMQTIQPSAATQWYWNHLTGRVCYGVGIYQGLVTPTSIQGTVERGALNACAQFFRSRSQVIAGASARIYQHFMQWARYNDPRCYDAPADWANVTTVSPAAVNVDPGRNMLGTIAGLAAGTTTLHDEYGSMGKDAGAKILQRAREIGLTKQIAAQVSKEMGVPIDAAEINGNLAQIAATLAQANQANALADAQEDADPDAPTEPQPANANE